MLETASLIAIPTTVLCELVWVLRSAYRLPTADIAAAIRILARVEAVRVDRAAVEEGLAMLAAGGDFADGVIAEAGRSADGTTFVSFDRRAVAMLRDRGWSAEGPDASVP